ncbi:MAG: CotH kinase family protein [Bacteroidales bacterium]|nr:CotH kinase family protein [Bacteroidales bacterium]
MRNITIYIVILIAALSTTNTYGQVAFTDSNLPIIVINTCGNTINNENPIRSTMKIIFHEDGNRNYLSDTSNLQALNYNGYIQIKLRGNSSQYQTKKPYSIHTIHVNNDNNNVSLLGLPPENDWVLNNIAFDPSYIRDFISYGLSEKMGNYAPRCRFCEVVIDGNYEGLYVFTEKMKADKNRIDIEKTPENPYNSSDYGYIIKADRDINQTSWFDYPYHTSYCDSIMYSITYPKIENIRPSEIEYMHNYYFELTENIHEQNDAIDIGFPSMIDIQSFIDFMLIGEFSSNVDIYQLSTYLHKDAKGKLRAGPVWDFNLTFGNDIQTNRSRYNVWQFSNYTNEGAKFWTDLFNNSTYRCHMSKRWHEVTAESQPLNYENVCSFIDETQSIIAEAVPRDCARWQTTNHQASNIDSMKNWIQKRVEWMNNNIGSCEQCQDESVPDLVISSINYNPPQQSLINSDKLEFIEITNNSDERVNLTGIYFGGMGLCYTFPVNSFLMPNQKATICSDSLQFVSHYAQIPFGQYTRQLSDQSQRLVLYDAWCNLIDEVTYSCNPPWPEEANGHGYFLELIDINSDNSLAENWRATKIPSSEIEISQQRASMVYPNPFYDFIQIETNTPETTYSIINAIGHEVFSGEFTGNATTIDTSELPAGIYIIRIKSDEETICLKIVKVIKG